MTRVVVLLAVTAALAGAVTATAASPSVGFYGCRGFVVKHPAAVVKPHSIVLACADANFYVTGIGWSTWTASGAAGAGIAHQNDCTPNCAAGHFHTYRATVSLSRASACKGHRVFTRVEYRFVATKPVGIPRSGETEFDC